MSKLLQALEKKETRIKTENGAKTFSSSLNKCLDLFFMIGASRNKTEKDIISLFSTAYAEDPILALKILAYSRDPRGGMGERRFFRIILKHLSTSHPRNKMNLSYIPEIGRWDDLLELYGTPAQNDILSIIFKGLYQKDGLCAKWMPRQGKIANFLRQNVDSRPLSPKEWRKLVVKLTKVVETQMCNREWAGINYTQVPSVANVKYNAAFLRNDEQRRRQFLSKAVKGEVKINTAVNYPSDIIKMIVNGNFNITNSKDQILAAEAMWKQLPDFISNKDINMMVVADTSGSMSGTPILVSVSLAMYISERNEGLFKNAYFTFSDTPALVYTKGTLSERLRQMPKIHPANTDLEATFKLLLNTAVKNKLKAKDLPTHLLIISDMEFDQACRKPNATLYKSIKALYKDAGYTMPNIVFWNVNSKQSNVPVRFNQDGVGLVSGFSPAVMKAVLSGDINPVDIMLRAVDNDRYKQFVKV